MSDNPLLDDLVFKPHDGPYRHVPTTPLPPLETGRSRADWPAVQPARPRVCIVCGQPRLSDTRALDIVRRALSIFRRSRS